MKRIWMLLSLTAVCLVSPLVWAVVQQPPICILSVDGGGARGIIPLVVLNALEKMTGKSTLQMFDVFAGASTGSIISSVLVTPNPKTHQALSAHDILGLYMKDLPKVFHKSHHTRVDYNKPLLSQKGEAMILAELLGDVPISKTIKPLYVISYNLDKQAIGYFSSWGSSDVGNYTVKDAVLASTATPGEFPAAKVMNIQGKAGSYYVDPGSIYSENPSLAVYSYLYKKFPKRHFIILALGTGNGGPSLTKKELHAARSWGLTQWQVATSIVAYHAVSGTAVNQQYNQILQRLSQVPSSHIIGYYRMNIPLPAAAQKKLVYASSQADIEKLIAYGIETVKVYQTQLKKLSKQLLQSKPA